MTAPILCLNCGKAKSEHTAAVAGDPFCSTRVFTDKRWLDPTPIENRVAEKIAAWLESMHSMVVDAEDADLVNNMAEQIRSGAWRSKP